MRGASFQTKRAVGVIEIYAENNRNLILRIYLTEVDSNGLSFSLNI